MLVSTKVQYNHSNFTTSASTKIFLDFKIKHFFHYYPQFENEKSGNKMREGLE